ncbi:hypothetical protein QCA50_001637 [Cerrena zonata]|uniref:PWI domain-containing protein n=1 Tax=Cerrena zonata TaxID=2478898 RepID=A0AAW0GNZ9_9APHY
MPLDPENATHLKPWLVKTLEPICDAEPGALADYILALLKHSAPETELRKELMSQLEEFLEKECSPFIDTLFTALRTKSYLPTSPTHLLLPPPLLLNQCGRWYTYPSLMPYLPLRNQPHLTEGENVDSTTTTTQDLQKVRG